MALSQSCNLFVYAVCGDAHGHRVNSSLRFLKRFSRQEILVVKSRCDTPIDHDQVLRVEMPDTYNNHQTSILLKTGLHRVVGSAAKRYCYLDSDVVAVSPEVDTIFDIKQGPIVFSTDHVRMRQFSRWAVRCDCTGRCDHLRQAILEKFEIEISDADWQHWNGGVFIFDSESSGFLDTWHRFTREILDDPRWKTRDQGTLIAAAWRHGLQNLCPMPITYNYIVDPFNSVRDTDRPSLRTFEYRINTRYSLHSMPGVLRPHFLHFIHGLNARGWKNWDDAETLLTETGA